MAKEDFLIFTAPYNFVPLNDQVVRPYWTDAISHDVPFIDGQCGTIEITIIAKQPVFTRNSVSRLESDEAKRKELGSHFSKNESNQYFIPGSSIKGAIRNVLEIMSFGDMAIDRTEERFSMRDLNNDAYKELFNYGSDVFCGWLRKDERGGYVIQDCGVPGRIRQTQIDTLVGVNVFKKFFESFNERNKFKKDSDKAAKRKYDLFKGYEDKLKGEIEDVNGQINTGQVVFTGQPTIVGKVVKFKEFIFGLPGKEHRVSDLVSKNFEAAYFEHDKNSWSKDYEWRREQLNKGESIPVFFHKNSSDGVESFGLAYMYKIPFTHSIRSATRRHQKTEVGAGPDMGQCIFGYTTDNDSGKVTNALKGRVQFGHAFALGNVQPMDQQRDVLSSPKPTYYPNYIRQDIEKSSGSIIGEYQTLFSSTAVPSGWKRYPVHKDEVKKNRPNQAGDIMFTNYRPLPAETVFASSICFQNLRKVELGALISALTFHQTQNCYHILGMAKPLGYGKCSISISGIDKSLQQECLQAFEAYMNYSLKKTWITSEQIKELFTMSMDQNNSRRSELKYMADVQDFAGVKRNKFALDIYSRLPGINTAVPVSQIDRAIEKKWMDFFKNEAANFGRPKNEKQSLKQLEETFEQQKESLKIHLQQRIADAIAKEKATSETLEKQAAKEKELQERAEKDRLERQQQKEKQAEERKPRAKKAREEGLKLDHIVANKRKPFENVKEVVENYICLIKDAEKFDLLAKTKQPEDSFLTQKDTTVLQNKLKEIFSVDKKLNALVVRKKLEQYVSVAEADAIMAAI